ncbi:MAG: sporulation protein [Blautia sp.]
MKRFLFFVCLLSITLFLLLFPEDAFLCASLGIRLWFSTLLPTLLPFLILSGVLIRCHVTDCLPESSAPVWKYLFSLSSSGTCALFTGLLCGFPMGAKITADLYKEKKLSKEEAMYLLTFSNFPSPSFLASYLCIHTFHNQKLLLPVFLITYLSGFLCSLLFRRYFPASLENPFVFYERSTKKEAPASFPLGEILDASIMNSFEAITKLGGYIILFSVFQGILKKLFHGCTPLLILLCSITELTTGISLLKNSQWPASVLFPLILGLTVSGGLCVAAQTKSMLTGTDLPFWPYVSGKILCFLIASGLSFLFVVFFQVI